MASVIRGSDNFDSLVHQGIGVNQTWQDVTASRAVGVTYTNTTGKPIQVAYTSWGLALILVNSLEIVKSQSGNWIVSFSFIVPNGATYKITDGSMGTHWSELR